MTLLICYVYILNAYVQRDNNDWQLEEALHVGQELTVDA